MASGLKIGDEGRILFEGSGYMLPAKISFIASEAQFSPKFVETRAEREKLLFRVTLKADPAVLSRCMGCFSGGMPALGYVRYRHGAPWPATLAPRLPASSEGDDNFPKVSGKTGSDGASLQNGASCQSHASDLPDGSSGL